MKGQQIRLIIIVLIGVVAVFAAKPIMTQVMLFQENQKAKVVTPPPDYVPPINPGGASMGGDSDEEADSKAQAKEESKDEAKTEAGESKSDDKPATDGNSEGNAEGK
ncbi:MAG: hypothetical protein ACK5PB_13820 [Pirellula sp.]|jgi:hypothetical protein